MHVLKARTFIGLLVLVVAAAGCSSTKKTPASSESAADGETLHEHMREHFNRVAGIRGAVISGDFEDAKALLVWIAEHPSPVSIPENWSAPLGKMQKTAAAGRELQARGVGKTSPADMLLIARATSSLAGVCGECHAATDASLDFPEPTSPPSGEELRFRMQRHQWASDRMWEGIIARSDVHWNVGASVMLDAPLMAEKVEADLGPAAAELGEAVRQHAQAAQKAQGWEARSEHYAALLAQCAQCHSLFGISPARPEKFPKK